MKFETVKCRESAEFKPIPDGWREAVAESVEIKETKTGTGTYLSIKFSLTDAEYNGRVIYGNFNIINQSQQAQDIGQQQLSDCARAMGFEGAIGEDLPDDTEWYLNRTCSIKIARDKNDAEKNRIAGYKRGETVTRSVAELTNSKPMTAPGNLPWQH